MKTTKSLNIALGWIVTSALAGASSATSFSWWNLVELSLRSRHNSAQVSRLQPACFRLQTSDKSDEATMAAHLFHEIYLHHVWHTKESMSLITPELEPEVFKLLRERCVKTKGVYLHGLNSTPTHVHLAINIEPFVTISDLVGELKGSSSFELNKSHGRKVLKWQRGFGVVSFGKQNLDWVLEYIANQKQHHAAGSDLERLECAGIDDEFEE